MNRWDYWTDKCLKFSLALLVLTCLAAAGDRAGLFDYVRIVPGALPTGGNDGELRVDSADNKLKKFSESSSLWEEITGGGGTSIPIVNLLADENWDFEAGAVTWTESAGSFTAETTDELFDTTSGNFNSSATAQNLDSTLVSAKGLEGASCLALISYRYAAGSDGDYKLQALDSSANILSEVDLTVVTTQRVAFVMFSCPVADTMRIRITSTANAGDLILDNAHLGTNFKLTETGQAELIGTLLYAGTTNCSWTSTSASLANFAADADCPAPSVTGDASAPGTKIPGITFANLPPGRYEIDFQAFIFAAVASTQTACRLNISDGTTTNGSITVQNDPAADDAPFDASGIKAFFEYTTAQSNITFQPEVIRIVGDGTCRIDATVTTQDFNAYVKRFPLETEKALTPDEQGWYISANIGGGNPSLGTGSTAAYTNLNNASLDLVKNGNSAEVFIACNGTRQGDGLVCGGGIDETLGIAVPGVPRAGTYEVCAQFAHNTSILVGDGIQAVFQIVKRDNANDTTGLVEGNGRQEHRVEKSGDASGDDLAVPFMVCGIFDVATSGFHTFDLMFEQEMTGGVANNSLVLADRNAPDGQRDVFFTMRPWVQNHPNPLIVNTVITPNTGGVRIATAYITNSGTPTVSRQDGTWIDSITDNSVGNMSVNFVAGTFSVAPNCQVDVVSLSDRCAKIGSATSTSTVQLITSQCTVLTAQDTDLMVTCTGAR